MPQDVRTVRTRIAPSPTGENLHIGNAYTALINYVVARQKQGQFIIRIEDTDRARLVEGSEGRILEALHWLGIPHAEGPDIGGPHAPYRQSERLPIYRKHAEELITKGKAYYCFCTSERLEKMRKSQEANHQPPMYDGTCKTIDPSQAEARVKAGEKHVVRLSVPDEGKTTFHDLVRGDITFENALIDDQVLLKSDGFPTYHLGVVVDDHLMEITHVIRGEEWISSTPKHILLYDFFGWEKPTYAHMPVLRNPDKSKLSKRKNPAWVSWFREQGFLPEAILNYLGTMAWSFPGGEDIFTLDELIKEFKLENVQTTAPIFDIEKLRWMNKQYLMKKDTPSFVALVSSASIYRSEPKFIEKAEGTAPFIQPRINTLNEYDSMIGSLYKRPTDYEIQLSAANLGTASSALSTVTDNWTHKAMEESMRKLINERNQVVKEVFMDLRVAITGKKVGPPLLEWLEKIGPKETLNRIEEAKKKSKS